MIRRMILQFISISLSKTAEMEANLHEVVDPGKQLGVDGEPAVELVPRLGNQPLGKLPLEHEDCTSGKMAPL